MEKIKYLTLSFLVILSLFLVSCSAPKEPEVKPENEMYTIYDGLDNEVSKSDNMWTSIIKAGSMSKNQNRHYVIFKDVEIYRYSLVKYYKYLSDTYIGETEDEKEAVEWANKFPNSYVINGKANQYIALGHEKIPVNSEFERGFEFFTGSYTYMFSKKYMENKDQIGYSYISFDLRFSEATLTYSKEDTEQGWNAYIFVNSMLDSPWNNNDIGIINNWEGHKGLWAPVFNFNGNTYNPDQTAVITQMELIDAETDTWGNADDLFFEIYTTSEEYIFNIENLGNGKKFSFKAKNSALKNNVQKSYLLLAASYVPVLKHGDIWNPRSGGAFENIIFENTVVANYNSSNQYNDENKIPFTLDGDAISYTLLQGSDNVSIEYGKHENDGVYSNGGSYKKDTEYIKTSIFYDNRPRK